MKTIRLLVVLASPALVAGCAALVIPPALSIASYATDGASYLATGKSLTDHAMSDALSQDCAMHRVIRLKNPCRDFTYRQERVREANRRGIVHDQERSSIASVDGHYGSAVKPRPLVTARQLASRTVLSGTRPQDRAPSGTQVADLGRAYLAERRPAAAAPDIAIRPGLLLAEARAGRPQVSSKDPNPFALTPLVRSNAKPPKPARIARHSPTAMSKVRPAAGTTRVSKAHRKASRFVVFGSFRSRGDAMRLAKRHADVRPAVVASRISGRTYFRVVAPAANRAEARRTIGTLKRAGVSGHWTIRACPQRRAAGRRSGRCLSVGPGRLIATDVRASRPPVQGRRAPGS